MLIDIIGWIGSVMVVAAYALNMYKYLAVTSWIYQTLNIAGSIFLIINTYYHHAIPSMVVNIIWIIIAVVAIVKKK